MIDSLLLPTGLIYLVISGVLFVFGANFFYLTYRTWRGGSSSPAAEWEQEAGIPPVTVQLPIYNEMYVAERVIRAVAQLDYPAELLQIQVLDDSTDETVDIIRGVVAQLQAQGVNIEHHHRVDRCGYKAGALKAGLASASGEFIVIFDADFVPPADFLRRALPYLQAPDVAFVQARWGHLNPKHSWLTYLQSLAIDAHFMVEQEARSRAGYWFNFNGTAGIWRRAAIEDAGGWTADTLTEDLDLSYRAHLQGWRGIYVRDLVVPAELPPSFNAFRRQQHRWARGSLECTKKLAPRVWRAPISFSQKFQATLHLGGYSVHLLLFALMLIYPLVAVLNDRFVYLSTLYGLTYLFALTSIAPALLFIVGQQQLGRPWWKLMPRILALLVVGSGLMFNTARAAWQIWRKPEGVFERTAKFGDEQENRDWTEKRYQLRAKGFSLDPIVYLEIVLGLYSLMTAWIAANLHSWGIAFFALLFASGLLIAAGVTVVQTAAVYRSRKARARWTQAELEWLNKGAHEAPSVR